MKRKTGIIVLSIVLVLLVVALVVSFTGHTVRENTIKIGYLGPLSGAGASWGETELKTIQIAIDEINSQGGINGKLLELIVEDGKCDGTSSTTATQKLVNIDGVKMIIGGTCSTETLAAATITEPKKVILISGVSSNPQISGLGKYIFVLTPTDEDYVKPMAEYAFTEAGYKKVAIITENTDYCLSAKNVFVEEFEKLGGKVLTTQIANPDERDYRTFVLKIKEKNPDAIILLQQTPITGGLMAKQIKELMHETPIFGGYTLESSEAIETAQGALENALIYTLSNELLFGQEVILKYKEKYNEDPINDALAMAAWDRVFIIAQALEECGEDTECIKEYIYANKFDLSLGQYGFNTMGEIDTFYTAVYKVQNGKAIPIVSLNKVLK